MKRLLPVCVFVLVVLVGTASAKLMTGATVVQEFYADPFQINISAMPSLSDLPVDNPSDGINWTKVDLPFPCASGNNTSTFIMVSRGNSENMLIYLEGGGACTDFYTCGNTPYKSVTTLEPNFTTLQLYYRYGIFDRANPLNPFKNWTIIFIPYSTGDIHWGNRVVEYCVYDLNGTVYPNCFTVHHVGYVNAVTAVRWASQQASQQQSNKVVVAGSSAGGYGTIIHSYVARELFSKPVIAIDDAGPGISANYSRPNFVLEVVNDTWGAYQNLPEEAKPLLSGRDAVYFIDYTLDKYSDIVFALFEDQKDHTIGVDFNGYTEEQFRELLLNVTNEIKLKHPDNFVRYLPFDNQHTTLAYPRFYTEEINNYHVYEWVEDLLNGKRKEVIEKLGDLDGNGRVDFNDLIATLNLILWHKYNPVADVKIDGKIDFDDLIGVLNIILSGG